MANSSFAADTCCTVLLLSFELLTMMATFTSTINRMPASATEGLLKNAPAFVQMLSTSGAD